MTPLRTRAIDAVTRETCPGFPAVCWACRDTAERAVDALLAAGLLHDPTCEARIERAARADEAVDVVTRVCREADSWFVADGGSTRHWARDHFLPALRAEGYVIALAAADQEDTDASS